MRETLAPSFLTNEKERDAMPAFLPSEPPDRQYAQIKLPPSVSLPGGLSIESTASLLSNIETSKRRQTVSRISPSATAQKLDAPFSFPANRETSKPSSSSPRLSRPTMSKKASSGNTVTTRATVRSALPVRESQVVLLQGLLQRKTDYRSHRRPQSRGFPFYSSASSGNRSPRTPGEPPNTTMLHSNVDLTRGWKAFYAVLRGTNLYLYKVPYDCSAEAKAIFQTSRDDVSIEQLASKVERSLGASPALAYSIPLAHSKARALPSAKCPDLLELQTEEGEVAILQAPSDTERTGWVNTLEEVGRRIADKRASYAEPLPEVDTSNTSASSVPHRSDSRQPAPLVTPATAAKSLQCACFGTELEDLVRREEGSVPKVFSLLIDAIERVGLAETGIYRVSGENRVVQAMKASFDGKRTARPTDDPLNKCFVQAESQVLDTRKRSWIRIIWHPASNYGFASCRRLSRVASISLSYRRMVSNSLAHICCLD